MGEAPVSAHCANPPGARGHTTPIHHAEEQRSPIAIDKGGKYAGGFTTNKMIHGWIENGGSTCCRF
jgi:hypothetical protein